MRRMSTKKSARQSNRAAAKAKRANLDLFADVEAPKQDVTNSEPSNVTAKKIIGRKKEELAQEIMRHLSNIGFTWRADNKAGYKSELHFTGDKESQRALYAEHRRWFLDKNKDFAIRAFSRHSHIFAEGRDIHPAFIEPTLVPVDDSNKDIFVTGAMYSSTPANKADLGMFRRLQYLVIDKSINCLMGIVVVSDPVLALKARDDYIGWDKECKNRMLKHVLDCMAIIAFPPYNQLLAGKVLACMLKSSTVFNDFFNKYEVPIAALSTTSSMGRSSVYNRLRIDGYHFFDRAGYTTGYGTFQIPGELQKRMIAILDAETGEKNMAMKEDGNVARKMQVLSKAAKFLDLPFDLIKHNMRREVFVSKFFSNSFDILQEKDSFDNVFFDLYTAEQVGRMGVLRWMLPRSERRDEWRDWTMQDTINSFGHLSEHLISNKGNTLFS